MNLAYVAGFFDGEGCVGFSCVRDSVYPRVLLTNTNREILEDLQSQFGGDIRPVIQHNPAWKQGWYLRLSWSNAVKFLAAIHPWVRIKRRQIETVFAWEAIRLGGGKVCEWKRQEYKETIQLLMKRMRWLNQKGSADVGPDPIDAVVDQMKREEIRQFSLFAPGPM